MVKFKKAIVAFLVLAVLLGAVGVIAGFSYSYFKSGTLEKNYKFVVDCSLIDDEVEDSNVFYLMSDSNSYSKLQSEFEENGYVDVEIELVNYVYEDVTDWKILFSNDVTADTSVFFSISVSDDGLSATLRLFTLDEISYSKVPEIIVFASDDPVLCIAFNFSYMPGHFIVL